MPSIFSSRWIRGAPHNGFAVVIRLINGRISAAVQGRLHRRRERSQKPAVAMASLPYAQSGEAVSTVYHFLQIGLAGQADDAAQCHQRQSLTVMKMKTTDQAEAANGISERSSPCARLCQKPPI